MSYYSVPASIRKYKPKGTMVKAINGSYYVYEYFCRKDDNGKWKTKMGKLVGTIREGVGFVPNDSYNRIQSNTTLEYGQYTLALAFANSKDTLNMLLNIFNLVDAYQIYFMALFHFVNCFTYLKNIDILFQQSYFAEIFPDLKLSYHSTMSRQSFNLTGAIF